VTTKRVVRGEAEFVGANGLEGSYEYVFSPVIAADSSAEFVVGSTRDISERKQVEVELRDRDEKFNQLANHITDVFWIRSADMTELHYLSPAFETIWGRPKTALETDPLLWSSYIMEDDRERVVAAFRSLTMDRQSIDEEYRILRPDGEMRWVRSRGFQVHDRSGAHIRNIGIVTDMTERRQAEDAVRQSQKRLHDVFDGLGPSLFVGLLTTDGLVVEMNRSPLDAAGLEASDVMGKPFAETYWWSHSADARRMVREAISRASAGEASRFDLQARGKGDAMIDVDFSLQPLRDESGRVAFLIPSGNVITERKVAEEALRQAQKMEAVGQLAAGVAHEFNNLMQALMSMTTMLRMRAADAQSAKIGADIESLIKRGAGLTQQLLIFSRHRPIETSALDLGVEVQRASELLRHLMPETIDIVTEIADAPLHAQGDAGQMQQVLLNLAINARDAMPDGGTLTLRAGRALHEVFLEVEDNGAGIEAEARLHLFEPFFTTKGPANGTGLGLAVAHGIVQQHGGHIEVDSMLGEGSRFRVLLPETHGTSASPVHPLREEIAEIAGGGGRRLLLLEDEPSVREGLSALLDCVGYDVVTASTGEEALALVMDPPPTVLLSDVTLPGIGGPATAKRLREQWPELKVVLMSGYADDLMRATASREGWHFLQKPFEFADLERMLETALVIA
jgi:PAS domain S-box-containing protein